MATHLHNSGSSSVIPVKHLMFAASLDRYLLQLKSLVRKGKVHGVLSERTRIGAHIRENLRALGLKRVSHHLTLDEILSEEEPDSEAGLESQRAAAQGQGTAEA